VTVTDASTPNRYVLDAVVVPPSHSRVLTSHSHQMTEERVCPEQSQPDVRGLGPVLQGLRVGEVIRARSVVYQRYHDLSTLQWNDGAVGSGTDHSVISTDPL